MRKWAGLKCFLCLSLALAASACEAPAARDADAEGDTAVSSSALSTQWDCSAFRYGNDVWMRSAYNGAGQFDLRVGAGGAVAELRDVARGYAPMLSPGIEEVGDRTDRVIQTVMWDHAIQKAGTSSPDARLNFNQAGTAQNVYSPTFGATITNQPNKCAVEVYSGLIDSWQPALSPYMRTYATLYTRYEMSGAGAITIRKLLYLYALYANQTAGISYNGNQGSYPNLYLENWIPFRKPAFDSVALSVDGAGNPNWYYSMGNLPTYPSFAVNQTPGYAIVYRAADRASGPMIGVAYGTHPAECVGGACAASSVLNTMQWGSGIGILPAINMGTTPMGSLIDQTLIVVPQHGVNAQTASYVAALAATVPSVKVYLPGATLPGDVTGLAASLSNFAGVMAAGGGGRTDNLGVFLP